MAGRHGWVALAWVVLVGCGDDAPADTNASSESSSDGSTSIDPDTSSSSSSADGSSSGATESTSTDPSTSSSGGESTSTGGESTSTTDGESTTTGESTTESTSGGSDPSASESSTGEACVGQPNGSMCSQSCECNSDTCYFSGILGGLCGECDDDADCPNGGCTQPEPLLNPPVGSVCNDGSLGGGCQSDDACQAPLLCAIVLDVPGVILTQTCSECVIDDDCGTDLCAPQYALPSVGGFLHCVAPGSQPDGSACSLDGTGDESCASGHCATADVMGLVSLGVCSECEDDSDCTMLGESCIAAEVFLDGTVQPAVCG